MELLDIINRGVASTYPQLADKWIEYAVWSHSNEFFPDFAVEPLEIMEALKAGVSYDECFTILKNQGHSGNSLNGCLGYIAHYAIGGPEFVEAAYTREGDVIDSKSKETLNKLKERNKKFEEELDEGKTE